MIIEKNCLWCGEKFKTFKRQKREIACCSQSCASRLKASNPAYIEKQRNARFNGLRKQTKANGYVYVWAPHHPNAVDGRVPEQNLIAEKALGRFLRNKEIVHHINEIKTDNRNENLLICTAEYHKWLHSKLRGLGKKVRPDNQRDPISGRFLSAAKEG